MSLRKLRTLLNYLLVILATLAGKHFFDQWFLQKGERAIAEEIIVLCELPPLPEGITVHHAEIMPAENPAYVDTNLTLTGPTDTLDGWLDKVDDWRKRPPGVIQNHTLRESEWSSRADFTAEVYLKPAS